MPSFGLPAVLDLPGTVTFRPDRPTQFGHAHSLSAGPGGGPTRSALDVRSSLDALLPRGPEVTGVYTYACQDVVHSDFYYIFRYHAFWMRPASYTLLQVVSSLAIKMLLMHAYASLFMLLSQARATSPAPRAQRHPPRAHAPTCHPPSATRR